MLMHDIVSVSTFKKWKMFWVRKNDINATSSHFLMLIYLFANHTLKILCKYILSISAFEIFRKMVYFTKSIKKSNKSKTHNQKQHHVWRHRVTYWENRKNIKHLHYYSYFEVSATATHIITPLKNPTHNKRFAVIVFIWLTFACWSQYQVCEQKSNRNLNILYQKILNR